MNQKTKPITRPKGTRLQTRLWALVLVATLMTLAYLARSQPEGHDHFGKPAHAQQAQPDLTEVAEPLLSESQVAAGISLRLEQMVQRGATREAQEGGRSGQLTAVGLQTTTSSAPSLPVPRASQEELTADNADVPPDIEQ